MSHTYTSRLASADMWLSAAEKLLSEGRWQLAAGALETANHHLAAAKRLLPSAPLG